MRVLSDVPPLRRARTRRLLAHALWLLRSRWRARFRVVHYSIQNDHLHLIVEAVDADALARGMQGLAVRIAKRLNHALGRKGTVWADRYHAHALKTPTETRNALAYVLHNGRHHAMSTTGAFVPRSCLDPCSSAAWFTGWKEPRIPRAPPEADPPVEPPHTWLLREGWRRAGGISVFGVSRGRHRARHRSPVRLLNEGRGGASAPQPTSLRTSTRRECTPGGRRR
jgi:REP element-mobilizing transposase RayT